MLRREFIVFLGCSLACSTEAATNNSSNPRWWVVRRANARVFLFGFGDAKDLSWFTPPMQNALKSSSELWLEVAPPAPETEASKRSAAELRKQLGHEQGRTFLEALEPTVRKRASAYIAELGIDPATIAPLRPWLAYYTINSAYWAQAKLPYEAVYVDEVLRKAATTEGKLIGYELPSREAFIRFMANMPDEAQSQYIEWLLDFLDEHKDGLASDSFAWIAGHPNTRSLDRMRTKGPALYEVMQVRRNAWWARKIDELLNTSQTSFVAVGQLHVLGPDGIPAQLKRQGLAVEPMNSG